MVQWREGGGSGDEGEFASREHLAISERFLVVTSGGWVGAFGIWRPGILLNILSSTRKSSTRKNGLAPNVNSAEVRKP